MYRIPNSWLISEVSGSSSSCDRLCHIVINRENVITAEETIVDGADSPDVPYREDLGLFETV